MTSETLRHLHGEGPLQTREQQNLRIVISICKNVKQGVAQRYLIIYGLEVCLAS